LQPSEIFIVCAACLFVGVLQFSKISDKSFFWQARSQKNRCWPLGNFLNFVFGSSLEIFLVYVACPEDDADEFFLPLYQNLFCKLFCEKI
jgi:hypothetical protein